MLQKFLITLFLHRLNFVILPIGGKFFMKKLLFLWFLLTIFIHAFGQGIQNNSLFTQIPSLSQKNYRTHLQKVYEFLASQNRNFLENNATKILDISLQNPFWEVRIYTQILLAKALYHKNSQKSISIAIDAYSVAKARKLTFELAEASKLLAFIYNYAQDNEKTIRYALEASENYLKLDLYDEVTFLYYDIALTQYRLENYELALGYFLELIKNPNFEKLMPREQINTYNAIALCYKKLQNFSKAFEYLNKAMGKALKFKSGVWVGILQGNKGDVFFEQKLIDSARYYWKIDLDTCQKYSEWQNVASTLTFYAQSYEYEKNYTRAYQYYKEAEKILQKTNQPELIHKIRIYSGLANVLYYLDSIKLAFEYQRKAHLTQDSLERFQKTNQVLQSQLKFLLQNKEQNYLLEKKVNEQIDFWTRVGIVILFIIVLILGYLLLRQSRLNKVIALQKMRIEAKNEEISRQNIELAEKKQEVESQQQTLERVNEILERYTKNLEEEVEKRTQEIREKNTALLQTVSQLEQFSYILAHNVRAPIARLQGLLMCLDMGNISNPQNLKIFEFIQQSAKELDDTIKNLNTIIQIRKGANEIYEKVDLKRKVEKQRASVIEVGGILETDLQVRYVYAIKAYVESIFYNLISNAIKYRDIQRQLIVKVKTYQDDTFLYVEVEDNGIGIDLEKNKDKIFGFYKRFHANVDVEGKGIGLHIVKLQVEAMGGKIEVESELDKGTKFKMTFKKPVQIDWKNV